MSDSLQLPHHVVQQDVAGPGRAGADHRSNTRVGRQGRLQRLRLEPSYHTERGLVVVETVSLVEVLQCSSLIGRELHSIACASDLMP